MNPHAGWSNLGLCVLCGSDDPADPCDPSPESMLGKIEDKVELVNDQRLIIQELSLLLEKVSEELRNINEKNFSLSQEMRKSARLYKRRY
ncbi:hypothetical protein EBZ39_11430 [bacterium]|nr:hypothetical protein [bacterium]